MRVTEMLRLYATPASVYSCKVRLALALKGLEWEEVAPPGGYGSAAYRALVPQGTVPAIDHDGFVLAESDAIVEYLDDIGAGRPLLPADPQPRARARALSRFIDTRLEPSARALFPAVGVAGSPPAAAREALARHLATLDGLAGSGPWLAGPAPGLPDCGLWAVSSVVAMLDRVLGLGLEVPSPGPAGELPAEVAGQLAAYRAALDGWAAAKGAAR